MFGRRPYKTNRPGIAAGLTQTLANASIDVRGFSASVIGTQWFEGVCTDLPLSKNR
jgi:predicted amino acid-binding ACT domain protein